MNDLAPHIEQFLDAHHVMTLATVGDVGAHAASLMYARSGFTLFWTSDPPVAAFGPPRARGARDRNDRTRLHRLPPDPRLADRRPRAAAGGRGERAGARGAGRALRLARRTRVRAAKLRAAFEQTAFYALARSESR